MDDNEAAEKRKSVALAASLFGDDSPDSDFFGGITAPAPAEQNAPSADSNVNDIFGADNTSNTQDDVNGLFSGTYGSNSNGYAAGHLQNAPTAHVPTLYADTPTSTEPVWPGDTTSQFTQEAPYTDHNASWQNGSNGQLHNTYAQYGNQTYDSANPTLKDYAVANHATPYDLNAAQPNHASGSSYSTL